MKTNVDNTLIAAWFEGESVNIGTAKGWTQTMSYTIPDEPGVFAMQVQNAVRMTYRRSL